MSGLDVDALAQEIRRVDGDHSLGAGALAEALLPFLSAVGQKAGTVEEPEPMTAAEVRLENLKQMAAYAGPIVSFEFRAPYYLASCDRCGWVGSSEHCGTDSFGDDSDCYCPRCHASGADCGKVAAAVECRPAPSVAEAAERNAIAMALARLDGVTLKDVKATVGDASDANNWRTYLGRADDFSRYMEAQG